MKIRTLVEKIDYKKFIFLIIISTIVYFAAAYLLQQQLSFTSPVTDNYPGYPLFPEPLEIPLYLLGYVIIPLLTLGLHYLYQKRISKYIIGIGAIVALILVGRKLDSLHLPDPGFYVTYLKTHPISHIFWLLFTKRLFVIRVALLLSFLSFLIFYFLKKPSFNWIKKIDTSKWIKIITPIFIILLAVILFHPNFPSEEGYTNYILTPAFETLNGKPLLYETVSIYGILNVYFVALLGKLFLPLTYKGFSLLLFFAYWGFFTAVFFLLKKWLHSVSFALIGAWSSLVAGFFLLSDPFRTAYNYVGQTSFRQGAFIFIALAAVYYMHSRKVWLRELILLLSAIALFWNIDTGIYINIAAFAALAAIIYQTRKCWLKDIFLLGLRQLAYIAGVFAVISITNWLIFNSLPDWSLQLAILQTFNSGYGKLPIPVVGVFLIYIITYLLAGLWLIINLIKKRSLDLVLVFLTVYGIFSFLYYVGNSAWGVLGPVATPVILIGLYAFKKYFDSPVSPGLFSKKLVISVFHALLTFLLVLSLAKLPVVFASRNYSQLSLGAIPAADRDVYEDAIYIKENFTELDRVALLHQNDGKLLLWAGKVNLFQLQDNDQRLYSLFDDLLIIYKSQIKGLLNQINDFQPKYVFVSQTSDERIADFHRGISRDYQLSKSLKSLDIYQRQANSKN